MNDNDKEEINTSSQDVTQDIEYSKEELDDSLVSEESAEETIKKLRAKVKTLTKENREYLTGWQKTKAEFVNARARDEEGRKDMVKYANMGLVEELIPVLESFDMAFANKEAWEKVDKNWRSGVEYIYTQIKKILEGQGLKEINPMGETFDPKRDEAVSYVPVDREDLDHKIIAVIQKGYNVSDRSLRAPKVQVGEYNRSS